jgi:hypothetical protein
VLLLLGALLFPAGGWDDGYMTYWAGHTLADFGRILNYNGDAVEQSSTLAFVLVIALGRVLLGLDASIVGRILSIAFGALTILAVARLGTRVDRQTGRFAPVIVATSAYFVYWTFGGMEATMAALAGVWLLIVLSTILDDGPSRGKSIAAGTAGLVFLLSRPESVFILTATFMGLAGVLILRYWQNGEQWRWEREARSRVIKWIAAVWVGFAAIAAFRLWYFGRMFPQPVYAKSRGLSAISEGVEYFFLSVRTDFAIAVVLAGVGAAVAVLVPRFAARLRSSAGVLSAVFVVASLGFIVASGGDGMHGGRFFVPAIPAAAVLGVGFLGLFTSARKRVFHAALLVWVIAQLGGVLLFARTQSNSDPLWTVSADHTGNADRFNWFERANHDHERYIPVVLELEKHIDQIREMRQPVSILSGQSGFVMYHLAMHRRGDIRYFDRFALVTRDFIDCPLSAETPRSTWGLIQLVGAYLRRMERFERECGINRPDLVYEIFGDSFPEALREAFTKAGYRIAFLQEEAEYGRSRLFWGNTDLGRIYIAAAEGSPSVHEARSLEGSH